ncbi:NUDIX hydrolase [Nocardioides sp. TRM66260-LWL]|uniref:NUDIX domain-containing protein n=1 Tax=Nocardioides sp. TRM66260-LWL TaxID=2874478 RepID=UPI001CC335FF|nr:NUDIX hydrolase [Nocardioides sp. TRM66260-LWL]MBZ5734131.1 NUDIX hydrolase [Nocardioides sp. TRM66260-LWL]
MTTASADDAAPEPIALHDEDVAWPVEETQDLHRDGWVVALRADRVRRPGSTEEPFRRLVLEHPGAVVVLALDDADRVLVLRQYRHPARVRMVELPAGLLDAAGEAPIDVARRELQEETGHAAAEWAPLLTAFSSPGISEERVHYFLARGVTAVGRGDFELVHEEADMTTGWVPFDELLDAVLDGRTEDGPLAIAVLAHAARRARGGTA